MHDHAPKRRAPRPVRQPRPELGPVLPAAGHGRRPSAMDRSGQLGVRPDAARQFHVNLRAALVAGAKLTAPTMVRTLRQAYSALGRDGRDPFATLLPEARALASIYAAWMETLDPGDNSQDARILKHLGDAGWIEAQIIVVGQAHSPDRHTFLHQGVISAADFVIGDGTCVPQRNDLAWLGGFAAALQGLSVGHGIKTTTPRPPNLAAP